MVDKKTSTIAVLCVITVLCLGLWSNEAQEANRLEGELWELEDDYEKLARLRTSLEGNYSELRTEKDELGADYASLIEDYGEIVDQYSSLYSLYDNLEEDFDALKDNYSSLTTSHMYWQRMYGEVKADYDELNAIFETGGAIAESAEWITEDERLKVTSKLITSGTYWMTYTVRVTIENIGDESMDTVWMFLFPYVDGKLCEYWSFFSYTHSVESIYIGETYSYNFTYLPDDMTSYKVLAVVG